MKSRVVIVSAHEGATTWVSLCRFIDETSGYSVRSFHQYDDVGYRSARSTRERLLLRLRTFVLFPLRFVFNCRRLAREADILVVVTSPFFMPVLAAWLMPKRVSVIGLMNDIYPEALVAKGLLQRDGGVERCIKGVFDRALRRLAAVVFISQRHKDLVLKDIRVPARVPVIPVSAHSDPFADHPPLPRTGEIEITYCGTLGLMHETGTFMQWLAKEGGRGGVIFSFYTSGASKQKFEGAVNALLSKRALASQVVLGNSLGESEWVGVMQRAQVGLVFQDSGSGQVIFPSKIASILASGQAVLAVADLDSDVARLILQNNCGWVVAPGDERGFDAAISAIGQAEVLLARRVQAFKVGQSLFGKVSVARQWLELFDDVLAIPAGTPV